MASKSVGRSNCVANEAKLWENATCLYEATKRSACMHVTSMASEAALLLAGNIGIIISWVTVSIDFVPIWSSISATSIEKRALSSLVFLRSCVYLSLLSFFHQQMLLELCAITILQSGFPYEIELLVASSRDGVQRKTLSLRHLGRSSSVPNASLTNGSFIWQPPDDWTTRIFTIAIVPTVLPRITIRRSTATPNLEGDLTKPALHLGFKLLAQELCL